MNRLLRLTLPVAAISLSACFGSASPPPQDHYYRLPPVEVSDQAPGKRLDTLAVRPMQTSGLHHERALLYVESTSALELRRYHYHFWILPPSQLVQEQLITYLRERGLAAKVLRAQSAFEDKPTIDGHLQRFERVIDEGAIRVDVELELQYLEEGKPVFIKEYRRTPRVDDSSMSATVKAFGEALVEIFGDFTAELDNRLNR